MKMNTKKYRSLKREAKTRRGSETICNLLAEFYEKTIDAINSPNVEELLSNLCSVTAERDGDHKETLIVKVSAEAQGDVDFFVWVDGYYYGSFQLPEFDSLKEVLRRIMTAHIYSDGDVVSGLDLSYYVLGLEIDLLSGSARFSESNSDKLIRLAVEGDGRFEGKGRTIAYTPAL